MTNTWNTLVYGIVSYLALFDGAEDIGIEIGLYSVENSGYGVHKWLSAKSEVRVQRYQPAIVDYLHSL